MITGLIFVFTAVLLLIQEVSPYHRLLTPFFFLLGLALLGYGSIFKRKKNGREDKNKKKDLLS